MNASIVKRRIINGLLRPAIDAGPPCLSFADVCDHEDPDSPILLYYVQGDRRRSFRVVVEPWDTTGPTSIREAGD